MILNEDVQLAMFRQSAFGAVPGTPNGILLPRGSNFTPDYDQKFIDNPQVFADGIEREPALGNKVSGATGDVVANLNFFPWLQKAITGVNVITGLGPYVHTSAGISRITLLHLLELGFIPLSLYYRYFDMVLSELNLGLKVEGIFTLGTKWTGSGNVAFPPLATSLDATPTEIAGKAVEFVDALITENGLDGADITSLDINVACPVKEKRVSGASGMAKELKRGKSMVSGTLEAFFESDARWARARAGTLTPIAATIAAGTDSTVITMPECKLTPVGPKIEGDDGILQKFSYKAIRKLNLTDTPIKFVTTCTTATVD